ncbi:MAG: AbrB/MazE/SpoVT family DNA-binding domain-containing protein [Proteobacteria bacterium]|nr:AbrB/MazE/SpoVT family DNA-binding domain-containing protein [Pseudomonadota bacterium]
MISTVTSKGQVTIPKEIRSFLDIKPRDKINFVVEDGKVFLKPVKTLKDFRGSIVPIAGTTIDKERRQAGSAVGRKILKE